MDSILVKGGQPLKGKINIAGAKNACLALMPLTLLTDEKLILTNAPRLSDINTFKQLLRVSFDLKTISLSSCRSLK